MDNIKWIRNKDGRKCIYLFGVPIWVDEYVETVTVDKDGKVYAWGYECLDICEMTNTWDGGMFAEPEYLGVVDLNGNDWKECKFEV